MNPDNEITMEMVREQQKALWDMIEEFRAYDPLYGNIVDNDADAVAVYNRVKKAINEQQIKPIKI